MVDASVAVKWAADEDDADAADWLLDHVESLIAPAHWLGEATNALWAKCMIRGEISKAVVLTRVGTLAKAPVATTPIADLIHPAAAIALDLRVTIYDALYLALAQNRNAPFVTADRRLFVRMQANKAFHGIGVWIADVALHQGEP